jgi:prepilin-type N-terminal cleavage/methylation domain-containing protein
MTEAFGKSAVGRRQGFSLLEAVVATAIIGVTAAAAMGALAAEVRGADSARRALESAALAQHRLAVMQLLPAEVLRSLPDSLSRGGFPAGFERYGWEASAREVRAEDGMVELAVEIHSDGGVYSLTTRVYSPLPLLVPR